MGATNAGFLQGFTKVIGEKLDQKHEEEQASIKERRANLWSEIQSVLADSRTAPEKQIYKGDHNAIVQEKMAAYLKFLSPETKKKSSPLGRLFQKLVPPKAKGGAPPQGPAQPPAQPQGNRQLQPPAAQAQVGQPQGGLPHMFTQEEQTQRQQEAEAGKLKAQTDEKIRYEETTSADKLKVQAQADQTKKELEEMKAAHAKELAQLKGDDAKTKSELEATKAAHAKEIAELKAKSAKEIAEVRAAAKPVKDAKGAGTSVADQVAKHYVPGGKSIANPTGDETIDTGAWSWIFSDHLPFTGFGSGAGKGAKNARELMLGRANELLADAGLSPKDLPAIRAKVKGDTGAYAKVTSMGALIQQFEGTLDRNMQVAQKLSDAWQRSDFQFVNRIQGAFKTGTGDSEALNIAAQLHGVAREWGKIMQGSVSAAGVQVSEANATDLLFSKGISNGQLASMMQNVIIPDMKNRTAAINGQRDSLVHQLRHELDMDPSPNGTLKPPDNAPPASGGAAGPKKGDKQQYNKAGYTFDGTQWVKDKK